MKFTELNLNENLLKGITEAGLITLMPVQEEAMEFTLTGRDAYVQSQTGTGKTAVFMITIFQLFLEEGGPIKKKKALIIAPTRELAVQIEADAQAIGKYLNFTIGCFYGGVGYEVQEKSLADDVDIIIGTPGRLLDFHQKKKMDFNNIGVLVIDEADRLFDMGFLQDIRRIIDSMNRRTKRLTMLFSATIDERTRAITREYMKDPIRIEIMPEQITVERVTQELYHVAEREKMSVMLGILKKENPKNVLIFTNMKYVAEKVAKQLDHNGYKCQFISGDLPQSKRLRVINSFKDGKLAILVATDVAARGLHVEDLELIINYDLPQDCENYVHRIGRTARAGKSGKAISLVCENYVYNLEAIEKYINMKIPVATLEENLFEKDSTEGMKFERPGRDKKTRERPREKTREKTREKPINKDKERKPSPAKKIEVDVKQKEIDKKTKPPVSKTRIEKKPKETRGEKKYPDSRDKKRTPDKKPTQNKKPGKPMKTQTQEDRLEYYKKKYGEDFKVTSAPDNKGKTTAKSSSPGEQKPSLIKKILSIFKRK